MTKIHHTVPATFRRAQLLHFTRHFLEMVVAMMAGMMVLGPVRNLIVAISNGQTFSTVPKCRRWRWPPT